MPARLRNRLSVLVVAISLVSLAYAMGYALGESSRPGEGAEPRASSTSRIAFFMPFFSFGQRATPGVR